MAFLLNSTNLEWASPNLKLIYRDPDTNQVVHTTPAELDTQSDVREHLAQLALGVDTEDPTSSEIRDSYTAGSAAEKVANTDSNDYNPGGGVAVGEVAYDTTTRFGVLFVPAP